LFSPCSYSEIHFDIERGNFRFLRTNIQTAQTNEFRYTYIFWKALEFAKFKLNVAKTFKPAAIDNASKIYSLVRDYTLFHAISDGDLKRVRNIINHHFEELNLNTTLTVDRVCISLFALAKMRKEGPASNGWEIYSLLADFENPQRDDLEEFDI
jgi:hypothetical protein